MRWGFVYVVGVIVVFVFSLVFFFGWVGVSGRTGDISFFGRLLLVFILILLFVGFSFSRRSNRMYIYE